MNGTNTAYIFNFRTNQEAGRWNIDDDGFLKCKTSVLKAGVLEYGRDELGEDIPDSVPPDEDVIRLLVPEDELSQPESIKSLEGKPIMVSHAWQSSAGQFNLDATPNPEDSTDLEPSRTIGSISGAPWVSDGFLYADILVTDASAVKRIVDPASEEERLIEQSAAYRCAIDWTPGTLPDGTTYHGIQRNFGFNHVGLLPLRGGRSGYEVRILNNVKKELDSMAEFTKMKVLNTYVHVKNEDVPALEKAADESDKEMANAIDPAQMSEVTGERDSLTVKLQKALEDIKGLENQLDAMKDPAAIANQLDSALDEQSDALEVMNSHGLKLDDKRRFGAPLKAYVVNAIRGAHGMAALGDVEAADEAYLKGAYASLKVPVAKAERPVVGSKVMNGVIAAQSKQTAPDHTVAIKNAMRAGRVNGVPKVAEGKTSGFTNQDKLSFMYPTKSTK